MPDPQIDFKKIRKALEEFAQMKKDFAQLTAKSDRKDFSQEILKIVSDNLGDILKPVFDKLASNDSMSKEALEKAVSDALTSSKTLNEKVVSTVGDNTIQSKKSFDEMVGAIANSIKATQIGSGDIVKAIKETFDGKASKDSLAIVSALQTGFKGLNWPTPKVEVTVPEIKIPEPKDIVMPDQIRAVLDYDSNNPLPVMLMGAGGKPFQFSSMMGASGGRGDFFTIADIKGSTASIIDQVEGALKVTGNFTVSGSASSTLAQLVNSDGNVYSSDNPLPITGSLSTTPGATFYASDAVASTNIIQVAGVAVGAGSGETQAGTLRIVQATDSISSTYVTGIFGSSITTGVLNGDNRIRVSLETGGSGLTDAELRASHLDVMQLSGTTDSVYVTGAAASTFAEIMNPDGRVKVELPAGPTPVSGTVAVSSVSGTTAASLVDSSGIQYSGSNPLPVSGSFTAGATFYASDAIASTNMIQIAGIAVGAGSGEVQAGTLRVVHATDVAASTNVIAVVPGTGATNLGKAEDAAHTTGDVGVMALAVRNDTGAALAGSDGDYIPLTVDATGALRTDLNGTVSTNNSTTATLLANAVFTGTSDDALNYNEIRVTVIASHASATDGLSLQQSSDNSNWDVTDTYTIPATTGKTYSVPRQARYFRVVYTNAGTNQTSFRLQTILNRLGSVSSSQRPNDAYTNETDLEQMQAFNMGFNGSTWDRIRTGTGTADTALRVVHAVDSAASVYVTGAAASTYAELLNADGRVKVESLAVVVSSITATSAATLVDSSGIAYSGSNPLPTTASLSASAVQIQDGQASTITSHQFNTDFRGLDVYIGGSFATTAASIIDSSGIQYSGTNPFPITVAGSTGTTVVSLTSVDGAFTGANPLPITMVSSSVSTTVVIGDIPSDVADTGTSPVKMGGIARTTNPTAVADGDRVSTTHDDLGRQVMRMHQVRDLIATAYVSLATGTETTLLAAGGAGVFLDLIMITATNNSSAATQLDIRATTAGNIIHTMYLPATSGPIGWAPSVPWPQDNANNNWTIDMPDQTGTTVYVSALFSKEV